MKIYGRKIRWAGDTKFCYAEDAPAAVYFLGIDSTISPHYVEINCVIFVLPDDRSDFLRENEIIVGCGKN